MPQRMHFQHLPYPERLPHTKNNLRPFTVGFDVLEMYCTRKEPEAKSSLGKPTILLVNEYESSCLIAPAIFDLLHRIILVHANGCEMLGRSTLPIRTLNGSGCMYSGYSRRTMSKERFVRE